MLWDFNSISGFFSDRYNGSLLVKGKWGLEKESLRITRRGELALSPHPEVFGDKIENPCIKTDFSESQIEMITPALDSIEEADNYLKYLHSVVERGIGDELLWPLSMPGPLPADEMIPVAVFNNSKDGREKEIYRSGLALRYGKKMQMISGIHYNFSFGDELWEALHGRFAPHTGLKEFINDAYFAVARNFIRHRWLLLYLFGASPESGDYCNDDEVNSSADYEEKQSPVINDATSVRMSSSGYGGGVGNRYEVSYNSPGKYVGDIRRLLSTKSKDYARFGIFRDGKQVQLNDNVLQTENEFYAPLRFKRIGKPGKMQLDNIESDGVQYMELRIFDLNPFYVTGISLEQLHFIHLFVLYCLFDKSKPFTEMEFHEADKNANLAAIRGRDENLMLVQNGLKFSIKERGMEILHRMRTIALILDEVNGDGKFNRSIDFQYMALNDAELLPSSWIVREMKKNNESHAEFGLRRALENRYYFCIDEFGTSPDQISGREHNPEPLRSIEI